MRHIVLPFLVSLATMSISVPSGSAQDAATPLQREKASKLQFKNDIMATMPGDQRLYVLLGSGFLRPFSSGNSASFVAVWLKSHQDAVVTPISRMISTNTITRVPFEIVYVWIEDDRNSLNVDLVRKGIFIGGTMFDMVDNKNALDRMLKDDPETRALVEKERASAPQDRTDRLILDGDYKQRMTRILEAERLARAEKLGIWSDSMKDEREVEGIR